MAEHQCSQIPNLKRIDKILFGNGQVGMIKEVEKLKETVEHMNIHLESLSTSYSSLAKSQIEEDFIKAMQERNSERWGRVIMRSTAIIGAAGVIITAIITFWG